MGKYLILRISALIILSALFQRKTQAQGFKDLVIFCNEKTFISRDSMFLKVSYINNTHDTLALPFRSMKSTTFQRFDFIGDPEKRPCCGFTTDYIEIKEDRNFFCIDNEKNGLIILYPHDTADVIYNLKDIGYILPPNLSSGTTFEFNVFLDIPYWFRNWCNNMWIGSAKSNIASLIVK